MDFSFCLMSPSPVRFQIWRYSSHLMSTKRKLGLGLFFCSFREYTETFIMKSFPLFGERTDLQCDMECIFFPPANSLMKQQKKTRESLVKQATHGSYCIVSFSEACFIKVFKASFFRWGYKSPENLAEMQILIQ